MELESIDPTPAVTQTEQTYRYWAFVSYSHRDQGWARRVQADLERRNVPPGLVGRSTPVGTIPRRLFPIFRDRDEIAGGSSLSEVIRAALTASRYLVVICSPNSAHSHYVEEEIRLFKTMGREQRIIYLIVGGEPGGTNSQDPNRAECFPKIARHRISDDGVIEQAQIEPVAADARSWGDGYRRALLKVYARLLNVEYDELNRRDRRWRRRQRAVRVGILMGVLGLLLTAYTYYYRSAAGVRRQMELSHRLDAEIDKQDWSSAHVQQLRAIAADLDRASAVAGEAGRRLDSRFADAVRREIAHPRLEVEDVQRISSQIDLLAASDPAAASALRAALTDRRHDWQTVALLQGPFDADSAARRSAFTVIDKNLVRFDGERLIVNGHRKGDRISSTRVACGGIARIEMQCSVPPTLAQRLLVKSNSNRSFNYEGAEHVVGVAMSLPDSGGSERDYRFMVRDGWVAIFRHETLLATVPVGTSLAAALREGRSFRILAQREGSKLEFQVGEDPPLRFEDLFPLPDSGQEHFGIINSSDLLVESLRFLKQNMSITSSPLERGDALFSDGKLDAALAEYRAQATLVTGEDREMALLKAGLCLLGLHNDEDAAGLFERILISGDSNAGTLAGCQLGLIRLRHNQISEAEAALAKVTSRYDLTQILMRVPSDVRDQLLGAYRGLGYGTNILRLDEAGLERLRRAVDVQDQFGEPDQNNRIMSRFVLAKAMHFMNQNETALKVANQTNAGLPLSTSGRLGIFEEGCWIQREAGRAQMALDELDRRLGEKPDPAWENDFSILLRVERARIHAALGEWDKAEQDIDEFFKKAQFRKGPQYVFSNACLIDGFLRSRRGDSAGAMQAWREGVVKADGSGRASRRWPGFNFAMGAGNETASSAMLGGLTGEWAENDGAACMEEIIGTRMDDRGLASDSSSVAKMFGHLAPGSAVYSYYATPRGRELARRFAFREMGRREYTITPFRAVAMEGVRRSVADGELTSDQDQVCWDFVCAMIDMYANRRLTQAQAFQAAAAYKGVTGLLGWQGLAPSLDPKLRGPAAYILARRYQLRLSKPKEAADFLKSAAKDAMPGSALERLVREEMAAEKSGS